MRAMGFSRKSPYPSIAHIGLPGGMTLTKRLEFQEVTQYHTLDFQGGSPNITAWISRGSQSFMDTQGVTEKSLQYSRGH